MKILIVGSWRYPMYERAFGDALSRSGHHVAAFGWDPYFASLLGRAEAKYSLAGPGTRRFNAALIEQVKAWRPDVVLAWRATSLRPSTLLTLRHLGVRFIASYNHDDFSGPAAGAPVPFHHHLYWRLFLKSAKYYTHHFVKRPENIVHLKQLGACNCVILPMWFVPELHRPVKLSSAEVSRFGCDVVFVGHYEPDDRVRHLRALVTSGVAVRLFGDPEAWTPSVLKDLYPRLSPITMASGLEYANALAGATVCLAFLSKLNRDTYTRRCVEIPACERLMLAERTDDLKRMFREDEEACFFSSTDELVEKVTWLLARPDVVAQIARAGRKRVWADGLDVDTTVSKFVSTLTGPVSTL